MSTHEQDLIACLVNASEKVAEVLGRLSDSNVRGDRRHVGLAARELQVFGEEVKVAAGDVVHAISTVGHISLD